MSSSSFNSLPTDCISTILSFTSPLDACRSSLVSSAFKSSAESDHVWERFLPPDYKDLVSRVVDDPVSTSSSSVHLLMRRELTKKELFYQLCNSVLIDGGNKILALERTSGLKSYIISPRELTITWSDVPIYWCWKSIPQSRFRQVVELITTSWLEIRGEIDLKSLSPNTTYIAYLIYRVTDRAYGLETMPMEASVKIGGSGSVESKTAVRLHQHCEREDMYTNRRSQILASRLEEDLNGGWRCECRGEVKKEEEMKRCPRMREDGYWTEVELGKFYVDEDGGEMGSGDRLVKMSLTEVKGHHLKAGLIIGGMQVRPELRF